MMEKICAACALEWSIELEKGLRSNKPGQPIKAILQIGPRLEQWSKEPNSTMAISNIFGLVPGEDRLFANTILLRLADAFKSGDKHTRACILKAFLLERRQCKKGKQYNGILSKQRVPNYLELLKRVKIVYDTGDVESRAVTLRLLGCWSDIAKDSAEIRHMIFSSVGSSHVLEVNASIFTAGCFSELSEDFAYVFLEVLINMSASSKTSVTVKLACVKGFAKLGYSFRLASRAYKTGRRLVLNSSQEDFIVEMLVSLSKLASKSMLLISEQVELLLSYMTNNSALRVQAMAIRCMLFILAGGVCRFPLNACILAKLFHVVNDSNLPTVPQCETLRILLKIFRSTQLTLSLIEMSDIVTWMSIVENATQSPNLSKRLLAFRLLVVTSFKCRRKAFETVPGATDPIDLPSRVLLVVLDQIAQMAKSVLNPCETASKLIEECQSLLSLVLCIVEEFPTLGVLALNKIRSCIESLVSVGKGGTKDKPDSFMHEVVVLESEKHCPTATQFAFCVYKFVELCTETLNEASVVTAEVHQTVKLVVEILHKSDFLNHDMCTIQWILLHSRVMWIYLANDSNEICDADNFGISHTDYWIEHERRTREFMKNLMAGQDNWAAYKAGKCAACQGAWFAASFVFTQLINSVQSNACQHWLKCLSLFAGSECSIMLLFLSNQGQGLVNRLQIEEIWDTRYGLLLENVEDASCSAVSWDYFKSFNEAYSDVCSALEMLAAVVTTDHTFTFQRWFLNLRANVLEVVVDILILLNSNATNEENTGNVVRVEGGSGIELTGSAIDAHVLANSFILISSRLKRLTQELDLLATSFMDMDLKSYRTISRLALNCSLLAFCTGFAMYFPSLHSNRNSMWCAEDLKKSSHSLLVQDLVKRLWYIDSETSTNLTRILTLVAEPNSCFHVPPRVPMYKTGQGEKETLDVCKFVLSGFLCMLEEAKGTKNEGGLYQESRTRLQLLSNVLKRWMSMSFQVPKYFFQLRSCIGAELFVFNADTRNPNGLSVFPGFHLSLNLCLQLKHVPPGRVTKLYCILASKPSYWTPRHGGESKQKMQPGFQPSDANDSVDLNEKLWMYVTEAAKRNGRKLVKTCSADGMVSSCVSCVLNERGQGFSTCLLDVSAFPVGSYKIKWHCCCIDSKDSYWSPVPLNMGPVFSVNKDSVAG